MRSGTLTIMAVELNASYHSINSMSSGRRPKSPDFEKALIKINKLSDEDFNIKFLQSKLSIAQKNASKKISKRNRK